MAERLLPRMLATCYFHQLVVDRKPWISPIGMATGLVKLQPLMLMMLKVRRPVI